MNRKYLPSKNFMYNVLVVLIIVGLFWGISFVVKYFRNKHIASQTPVKVMIKDLIQKDTNENGIPDWEESLWGLNPNKNGKENKEFIDNKKKQLSFNPDGESSDTLEESSRKENEALSQEYFAVIMSLLQSGNLTQENLDEISSMIGEQVETTPIPDSYTKEMLIIKGGEDADIAYLGSFDKLMNKYQDADMGGELLILAQAVASGSQQIISTIKPMALSYQNLAKELSKIPVPANISSQHLKLINDCDKTGKSISDLSLVVDNPLIGMKSLLNYKKYGDAIISDIEEISSVLE